MITIEESPNGIHIQTIAETNVMDKSVLIATGKMEASAQPAVIQNAGAETIMTAEIIRATPDVVVNVMTPEHGGSDRKASSAIVALPTQREMSFTHREEDMMHSHRGRMLPICERKHSHFVSGSERRLLIGLLQQSQSPPDSPQPQRAATEDEDTRKPTYNPRSDVICKVLSAFYCKLLVVLGLAVPVTEVLAHSVPTVMSQWFYVYLYTGSILFISAVYVKVVKEKAVDKIVRKENYRPEDCINECKCTKYIKKPSKKINRYGGFYLRLAAVGFGVGTMVYSGLDIVQYLEIQTQSDCKSPTKALTPALRMVFTIVQMQFIFLNSRNMDVCQRHVVSRFGLMHVIATNLCQWLNIIVQETKHEIVYLNPNHDVRHRRSEDDDSDKCNDRTIMATLVHNVSPYLFPCTIEYSLICAVIVFEMWKHIRADDEHKWKRGGKFKSSITHNSNCGSRSAYHFSVDCANAHRGLFAGILVIVVTIISLIIFYVLKDLPEYHDMGIFEMNICEITLYSLSSVAVVMGSLQMRKLYSKRDNKGLSLDTSLLILAQAGVYMYSMFSLIGCYFTTRDLTTILTETLNLLQTTIQTLFVLDAWSRRSRTAFQYRRKPGRQLVTFLLVVNMAVWIINSLEKNRAQFRPKYLNFFGVWAWTIITHVSMPLVIFYRFHSTICLFEIWKKSYKIKSSSSRQDSKNGSLMKP